MKQSSSRQSMAKLHSTHDCPVRCHECHFEGKVYPARWNRAQLDTNQSLAGMIRSANHILFLMKGCLHIRTAKNEGYDLASGQCTFFVGKGIPQITACAPSEVIWLDFSHRVIFGHRDCLTALVAAGCSCRGGTPVLPLHPRIRALLEGFAFLESPCHHLLKQYELFMYMTDAYTIEELAGFFQPILRPVDDLRAFVISNYKNAEGVEDFARRARMSKSCFIRKFREAFGMTIHQWMMKQKEKDLCGMIRNGKYNTKELTKELGMKSPASLYQFCRTHFGCTASELTARLSDKKSVR